MRRAICLRADVHLPDGTLLAAHSTDISETGIGLLSPRAVDIEQDCRIVVRLAACGVQHDLTLVGRVCYCIDKGGSHRIGMRFVGLNSQSHSLLAALLDIHA